MAYSFLQGENTRSGRLDDDTIVSQVQPNRSMPSQNISVPVSMAAAVPLVIAQQWLPLPGQHAGLSDRPRQRVSRPQTSAVATVQVASIVSKCGEASNTDVQLAVIRALLTITTAEHFRCHGDCLVQVSPC